MFESYKDLSDFPQHFYQEKRNVCIIGPGAGRRNDKILRQVVLAILRLNKLTVLDADALNIFEGRADELISSLHDHCVLTPHQGEFVRLFPDLKGSNQELALQAAELTGAVVLLKGADTIICTPTGETIINNHSTPYLATAGSGDVLAGIIGGFLAQGMAPYMACAAATWIHGEAALRFGSGLTAPDIIYGITKVLQELYR